MSSFFRTSEARHNFAVVMAYVIAGALITILFLCAGFSFIPAICVGGGVCLVVYGILLLADVSSRAIDTWIDGGE